MSKYNKIAYFLISTIFFISFDVYFSELILNNLRYSFKSNPIIDLIFVQNTGAAFSIFENSQLFLIIFSILALLMLLIYAVKHIEKYSTIASFWVAMLSAGIICNASERIFFGYVRDYFKLNFIDFPVFNISDIFINIGVIAIIIIILRKTKYFS